MDALWPALVAFLGAATLYLGTLARQAKKAREPRSDALALAVARIEQEMKKHDERLDCLDESDRDKDGRLIKLEAGQAEAIRRMDARDKAAEAERAEIMTMLRGMDGKLDALQLHVYTGGKA